MAFRRFYMKMHKKDDISLCNKRVAKYLKMCYNGIVKGLTVPFCGGFSSLWMRCPVRKEEKKKYTGDLRHR